MNAQRALKILNEAYKIEVEGYTFYKNAEKEDMSDEAKTIFNFLANEEKQHEEYIASQIKNVKEKGIFGNIELERINDEVKEKFFLDSIKVAQNQTITESSALHIGILLEKNSYDFYTDAEKESEDPEEAKLYSELAEWELNHLNILQSAYKVVREKIFADQNFSPF